jgi:hypothetical protein
MRYLAYGMDLVALVVGAVVFLVAITGGGATDIFGLSVSLTRTGYPMAVGATVLLIRYLYFARIPFLGFRRSSPAKFDSLAERARGMLAVASPAARWSGVALVSILAGSIILRLVNAWAFPGFTAGDDVEIHEMTLGALLGMDWPVWELRSSFYPMTVIYPAQALALSLFGPDIGVLVFAGRAMVVAFATLTIWFVFRITLTLSGNAFAAVLAAGLIAASRLHLWLGSSELPRPVASVLMLAAFWMLLRPARAWHAALAGLFIGVGGALRFSELVFFLPAVVHLSVESRVRDLMLVVVAGGATALTCLGVADWIYWGSPWSSLLHIIDYTLVRGESSRGFQPFLYYLTHVSEWTNVVVLALGFYALALPDKRAALWAWIPIAVLTLLPHKEPRYVLPALPFLCIAAVLSLQHLAASRLSHRAISVIFLAAATSLAFEVSNWRPRRTDEAVRLAQVLSQLRPSGIAAEQLWRLGGRLYFAGVAGPVIELNSPADLERVLRISPDALLLLRSSDAYSRETIIAHGYTPDPGLSSREYMTWLRLQR